MKEPWYKSPLVFTLGAITAIGLGVSAFNDGVQPIVPESVPVVKTTQLPQVQTAQTDVPAVTNPTSPPTLKTPSPIPEAATAPTYSEASYYSQSTYYAESNYYSQGSYQPAEPSCNKNYSGCLKPDASDYDCEDGTGDGPYYTGPVQVIGKDVYRLDNDKDGWGCEN